MRIEMAGRRFDRLVAIEPVGQTKKAEYRWLCVCDCGKQTVATGGELRRGGVRSCGCLSRDTHTTHGHGGRKTKTRTYRIWAAMKTRATNHSIPSAVYYSKRGIGVCERWNLYENFLADMGEAPEGMSIDRIDVNGNYEPSNCRWATARQQARNSRRAKLNDQKVRAMREMKAGGMTGVEIAKVFGVSKQAANLAIRGATWSDV